MKWTKSSQMQCVPSFLNANLGDSYILHRPTIQEKYPFQAHILYRSTTYSSFDKYVFLISSANLDVLKRRLGYKQCGPHCLQGDLSVNMKSLNKGSKVHVWKVVSTSVDIK